MKGARSFLSDRKRSVPVALCSFAIIFAGLVVYHNSLGVPFLFDDEASILDNSTIRHLWPLSDALSPPTAFGLSVSGRPIVNLSLALNYALTGFQVWSYHLLNLAIHVAAGLTLLGVVRRTLERTIFSARLRTDATPIAFVAALLWTVHPLQTESVTYVIQRAESLAGLCYLLTFYAFIRSTEGKEREGQRANQVPSRPVPSNRATRWRILSVVACLIGVGCKEVLVTAPLLVFLYDRTFVTGNFRFAWFSRRWFYGALLSTWLPLAWLVLHSGGDRGGTFQLSLAGFIHYGSTQFEAVTRYLRLSIWPSPLIFDYGSPLGYPIQRALLFAAPTVPLLIATVWSLVRRPVLGFCLAFFLLNLAPTSLMPGTIQYIVEHRMYLPLAALIVLAAASVIHFGGRLGFVSLLLVALGFGALTIERNAEYRNDLALWSVNVSRRPESARAQSNLGRALFNRGRVAESISHYQEAIRLDPAPAQPYYNLGLALERDAQFGAAINAYEQAVQRLPLFVQARFRLASTLIAEDRANEAGAQFKAIADFPAGSSETHVLVGRALMELGKFSAAADHFQAALRLDSDSAESEAQLGAALHAMGRENDALNHLDRALRLNPRLAETHFNFALVLAATGRFEEAQQHYVEAAKFDPGRPDVPLNLGILLAQRGQLADAEEQLRRATTLRPRLAAAFGNLGIVLAERGRFDEAIESYHEALRLQPSYAAMHYNLGNALLNLRRVPEARAQFEEAVRLQPDFGPARELLDRLRSAPLRD